MPKIKELNLVLDRKSFQNEVEIEKFKKKFE